MSDTFGAGETDSERVNPPITQEVLGARHMIAVGQAQSGRGEHVPQRDGYLMPSVHYVNGNMETVAPKISLTPLGGMMPGPNAIAPPTGDVTDYRAPVPDEAMPFDAGINDGYPEGCPVPHC